MTIKKIVIIYTLLMFNSLIYAEGTDKMIQEVNIDENDISMEDQRAIRRKVFHASDEDYPDLTYLEKDLFVDTKINKEFAQYNPYDLPEPIYDKKTLIENEKDIELTLQKCMNLIGVDLTIENPDKRQRAFLSVQWGDTDPKIRYMYSHMVTTRTSPLGWYMQRCSKFLYGEPYNLNNFSETISDEKQKQVEELYAKAYLNIKKMGMLRQVKYSYYPKSLVREHAEKTGLLNFIKDNQENTNIKRDDEWAVKFFGTKDKWFEELHSFLDNKILENY